MSLDQARDLAEQVAGEISREFDIRYRWDGDHLEFRRTGARGKLILDDRRVQVKLYLEMMLMPMRRPIEKAVANYLDEAIEGARV